MGGSGSDEIEKCPPPSPAVLWFVNVCEREPRYKTKKKKQTNTIKGGWTKTFTL